MTHPSPLQIAKPIALDLLGTIAFAAAFFIAKYGFGVPGLFSVYIAAITGIGIGFVQLIFKKLMREAIGPLHWLSLGVVLILGLMTIVLHDAHYIKLRPSVIDFSVGLFMATRDWMTPYIPQEVRRHLGEKLIFRAEKAWAILMFGFSLANIAVAFLFDFAVWTLYSTFVPAIIIIILFFVQYSTFKQLSDRAARKAGGKI